MYSRTKWILILGFIVILFIFISITGYGLLQFNQLKTESSDLVKINNEKSQLIFTMLSSARVRLLDLYAMVSTDDPFLRDDFFMDFGLQGSRFAEARIALLEQALSEDEKSILSIQRGFIATSQPIQNQMIELIQADELIQAKSLLNEKGVVLQDKVINELIKLVKYQKANANSILGIIDEEYNESLLLIYVWSSLALLIGFFISIIIIRKISNIEGELKESNLELENRVAIRTVSLEKANQELNDSLTTLADAQEQLVNSEKMASLGQLVAGVAHEINTPVGIGVTAASHLSEITDSMTSKFEQKTAKKNDMDIYFEKVKEDCYLINENLARTSELVKSFKLVSSDQASQEMRQFEIKAYLENIILSLKPKLKQTQIVVIIDCPQNINLYSYPGALSQMITNFIINSIIHGYDGGDVEGTITISAKELNNTVQITYTDDGKGVPSEALSNIFEPFFTTKRGSGSTGLGLNIIYNIVNQTLNGNIDCESIENKGIRFNIEFPLQKELS